ncbi:hydantoinase B/oxoprolinase family protein, partial [Chloroflexota bacterium]
ALSMTIAYSGMTNEGTTLTTELKVPYDTLLWPSSPFISTVMLWGPMSSLITLFLTSQSRAFFSRGFREEVLAGSAANGVTLDFGGTNQYGMEPFGFALVDTPGVIGSGARGIMDGIDNAFLLAMPQSDAGNCEVWELVVPLVWLGRKMQQDSYGYGRYRGGCGLSSTYMIYKTPSLYFNSIATLMAYVPQNSSMFGGYPSPTPHFAYMSGPNTKELIAERRPLVHEWGDPRYPDLQKNLAGVYRSFNSNPTVCDDVLKEGDMLQTYCLGGGGLGDPLERDIVLIKKDLDNGELSMEVCRNVYFVEAKFDPQIDEYIIDEQKTKELREEEKKRRLKGGIPVREWWQRSRQRILSREYPKLINDMYNDSLAKGERWPQEFRAFWDLSEDFTF